MKKIKQETIYMPPPVSITDQTPIQVWWKRPHRLFVRTMPTMSTYRTMEISVSTRPRGCACTKMTRAIANRRVGLNIDFNAIRTMPMWGGRVSCAKANAYLRNKVGRLIRCPFCRKSAVLSRPRMEFFA